MTSHVYKNTLTQRIGDYAGAVKLDIDHVLYKGSVRVGIGAMNASTTDNHPHDYIHEIRLQFCEVSEEPADPQHPWRGQEVEIIATRNNTLIANAPFKENPPKWNVRIQNEEGEELLKDLGHYGMQQHGKWMLVGDQITRKQMSKNIGPGEQKRVHKPSWGATSPGRA